MRRTLQSHLVPSVVLSLASVVCFAQSSGQATYKAKCQMCHGATGTPSPGMAKMMSIKPVTGLSDGQIKDAVAFYRGLN